MKIDYEQVKLVEFRCTWDGKNAKYVRMDIPDAVDPIWWRNEIERELSRALEGEEKIPDCWKHEFEICNGVRLFYMDAWVDPTGELFVMSSGGTDDPNDIEAYYRDKEDRENPQTNAEWLDSFLMWEFWQKKGQKK